MAPALTVFFSSESQLPLESLSLSSASKTACLSSIRLLGLHWNHESHSHFDCAGAGHPEDLGARSQGQGREGALVLFIWWGAGEAFLFLCTFLLAADLALSIRLTSIVTLFHQEKLNI